MVDYTFKDSGRVLMIAQWWNKCIRQDTFMFRRLDVCKKVNTTAVKTFINREPKLVGIYDMLGRPVANIRKDEIMIFLYDDGSTKKVLQH